MFIINLTYKVPLDKVDSFLQAHVKFLDEQYEQGTFLASGPKIPRDGGVILALFDSKAEALANIEKDPFYINGIAEYEVTEFQPKKTSEALKFLQKS